jgi:xanthosine utilization system XapX-like protein
MSEQGHKRSSWVSVLLLIAASILLGLAFPFADLRIPLIVAAAVLGLAGLVVGWRGGIMEDVT